MTWGRTRSTGFFSNNFNNRLAFCILRVDSKASEPTRCLWTWSDLQSPSHNVNSACKNKVQIYVEKTYIFTEHKLFIFMEQYCVTIYRLGNFDKGEISWLKWEHCENLKNIGYLLLVTCTFYCSCNIIMKSEMKF